MTALQFRDAAIQLVSRSLKVPLSTLSPLVCVVLLLLLVLACSSAPNTTGTSPPAAPIVTVSAAASLPAAAVSPGPSPVASVVPQPVATGNLDTVKVIHVPSVLFAPLYVAVARGFTREQGLDVQLDVAGAGQDAMPLLANGQVDVVVGGFAAGTFNAIYRGLDLRIVASMGRQPDHGYPSGLMVRQDLLDSGQVNTIADLKGRKVAMSGGVGATGSYWIATKLRPAGLNLSDIEPVNMGFPDMVVAFKSGAIDAGYPSAPATTQIRADKSADFFGGITAPGASAVGVMYSGQFIHDRPDVAGRLMVALIQGSRAVQGADCLSPENLQAYSTYTGSPVDVLRNMDAYDFDPNLAPDPATLLDMENVFIAENVLQLSGPIPAEAFVDSSFQSAAVQQLGAAAPSAAR